jgi:glycerol-3-phosphate acyltransferase PlsY
MFAEAPWIAALLVGGYLLGSLSPALVLSRALRGVDLRTLGSGNLGASNVQAVLGNGLAVAVLLIDAAKGALAVLVLPRGVFLLAGAPEMPVGLPGALAAAGAVLGHCFPFWLRFLGGKGVATTLGAVLAFDPVAGLGAAAAFVATVAATRFVAVGSLILVVVGAFLLAFLDAPRPEVAFAIGAAVLVHVLHRGNLDRMRRGEEERIPGGS